MKELENIMHREMTRKEFLAALGFGLASIFGFSAIVRLVFGHTATRTQASLGYGSSLYGGRK